jgi:hypothetical protein
MTVRDYVTVALIAGGFAAICLLFVWDVGRAVKRATLEGRLDRLWADDDELGEAA